MILPDKHISLGNSLLGGASVMLRKLRYPRTVSRLWHNVRTVKEIGSFQRFALILDFLFALGLIELKQGMLQRRII